MRTVVTGILKWISVAIFGGYIPQTAGSDQHIYGTFREWRDNLL